MLGTLIFVCSTLQMVLCGRAPTWDFCHCYWETWRPWSSCTETCGGGLQVRERRVNVDDTPACDKFERCATNDMGWEGRICNSVCYHGGTFHVLHGTNGYCLCLKGNKGSCCEQVVNCGAPSEVSHGKVSGTDFTYGHTVHYTCDADFNMTNPSDAARTCSDDGYWTGRSPICLYASSCNSNPCRNGATCTNNLGGYDCTCVPGWTGTNCQVDIKPPDFDTCPKSKTIYTSNMTHTESWTAPIYTDPFGGDVVVTKNYESNTFTFPWGHHTVQYTGTKPSNGLSTECTFTIDVQPHPCIPLEQPAHGIVACNNWNTKHSSICKLLCKEGYTYPPGFSNHDLYVCAASGHWFPSVQMSQCVSPELYITGTRYSAFECHNGSNHDHIADYYIRSLKSSNFNSLCENHPVECHKGNVFVNC